MTVVNGLSSSLDVLSIPFGENEESGVFAGVLANWRTSIEAFCSQKWDLDVDVIRDYEPVAVYNQFNNLIEGLKKEIPPGFEIVVCLDDHSAIEGCAIFYDPTKDRQSDFDGDRKRMNLLFMVTNPKNIMGEEPKTGVGRQIIKHLEVLCRKAGLIGITLQSTTCSLGFYEKMGFQSFGYQMNKDLENTR